MISGISMLLWLFASLLPPQAAAQEGTIDVVAGPLASGMAGMGFGDIIESIAVSLVPLVGAVALFAIVFAGVTLIISQDESQLGKARMTIIAAGAAIIIISLVGPLHSIILAPGGTGGEIIATEIAGLISWLEVPVAVIAVLMIIISGLRTVIAYGSDEGATHLRQTVISILFGLIILSVKGVLSGALLTGEPSGILGVILTVINVILGIGALVATAVIVLAGFYMIVNIGNEQNFTYARSLIVRVAIGLIVILVSFALANLVIFVV